MPFAVRVIKYTQPAAIADSGVLVALHPGAAARLPFVEEDLPFVEEDRWKQKVLEPTRVAKGSENKFTMKITIGDFQFQKVRNLTWGGHKFPEFLKENSWFCHEREIFGNLP